jgi:hypothetical protein
VFLYAFDLIELNGDDLRREPMLGLAGRIADGSSYVLAARISVTVTASSAIQSAGQSASPSLQPCYWDSSSGSICSPHRGEHRVSAGLGLAIKKDLEFSPLAILAHLLQSSSASRLTASHAFLNFSQSGER